MGDDIAAGAKEKILNFLFDHEITEAQRQHILQSAKNEDINGPYGLNHSVLVVEGSASSECIMSSWAGFQPKMPWVRSRSSMLVDICMIFI